MLKYPPIFEKRFHLDISKQKCGTITVIGRPNVGKSTLINHILGEKISITCRKPQTTRHQILGIKTEGDVQCIYVDTPGMHKSGKRALNRYMNRSAKNTIFDVDCVAFLIDSDKWTDEEDFIVSELHKTESPVVLVINKVDMIKNKNELLPLIEKLSKKFKFADIVPVSAKHNKHLDHLETTFGKFLPYADFMFDEDQITDKSMRFIASEIIREKLMRTLGDEIPYDITVEIEHYKTEKELIDIAAIIYVARSSQKAIIIGKNGGKLKEIGKQARIDIENMLDKKVFLRLWVKVKTNWADDEKSLQSLGYD